MSYDRDLGPPGEKDGPGTLHDAEPNPEQSAHATNRVDLNPPTSAQVCWWAVREFVAPALATAQAWPFLGSPAWCALADDDPAKLAALFDAAQHWALRLETCQQARADASREISAVADWSHIAHDLRAEEEFYTAKPWLRRVAS